MLKPKAETNCFHCGETVPENTQWQVVYQGATYPVCCAGCQAVVQFIATQQLGQFYQRRDQLAVKVDLDARRGSALWTQFNQAQYWGKQISATEYQLDLIVDGLRCGACIWLLRSHLMQHCGIADLQADLTSNYVRIRWNPNRAQFSDLLEAIEQLGYQPHLYTDSEQEVAQKQVAKKQLLCIAVAGLGMMQVMMYAVALYAGAFSGIDANIKRFLETISLLIATPVVVYSGQAFFFSAYRAMRAGRVNMDVPVALAISIAYLASLSNYFRGHGEYYFDSVVMLIFLLLVARYFQGSIQRQHLSLGNALSQTLPNFVSRLNETGEASAVPYQDVKTDDRLLIRAGEMLPTDVRLLDQEAYINDAFRSGESRPLHKQSGEDIAAGSINLNNSIRVEAAIEAKESSLQNLLSMISQATLQKPAVIQITDRIAGWFVLGVLLLSAGTAAYWWQSSQDQLFSAVLSVLVITCPCALSLATPTAVAAAGRYLLSQGVALADANSLLKLPRINRVVFDKTGTLTDIRPGLHETCLYPAGQARDMDHWLSVMAALQEYSEHPLAQAFAAIPIRQQASDVQIDTGHGLSGRVAGQSYRLGRLSYVLGQGSAASEAEKSADGNTIFLACAGQLLASVVVKERLRADAKGVFSQLRKAGIQTTLLSGDRNHQVENIARQVGADNWLGEQSPEDKLHYIQSLQAQGQRIMMVGDGINDAAVLAVADVSVAANSASHLTQSKADLFLLSSSLQAISTIWRTGLRTRRITVQNIIWAILYNCLAVPVAFLGGVPPWLAAIGMSFSSLFVVLNATRVGKRFPAASAESLQPAWSEV